MKNMKKILALLVAVMVLIASMSVAFAAPTTNNSLTIDDSRTGRTYVAYQILTGEVSGSEGGNGEAGYTLANLNWGNNSGKTGALTQAEIDALPAYNASREDIKTYIDTLTLGTGTNVPWNASQQKYVLSGLTSGWYYVLDNTVVTGTDDYKSAFLTEVIGDATATPKGSTTTPEKKVDDINDSTNEGWTEKDSADYDVGDDITFTLKATLGNDLTDYETYALDFVDNLSKGLTYKELVSVTVDGANKDTSIVTVNTDATWAGSTTAYEDGSVVSFSFADVLDSSVGAHAGSVIVIKYKATLNNNAVFGSAGNPNKLYIEYSNNPDSDGKGKSPEDTNKVFTYKAVFDKFTTEEQVKKHLAGAQFKFFKVKSDITDTEVAAITKDTSVGGKILKIFDPVVSAGQYENEATAVAGSVFTFNGLDDGVYVLVETQTPTGYNTAPNAKYTVTATHSEEAAEPVLITFSGNMTTGVIDNTGTAKTDGNNANTDEIVNNKGTELPSTGGIGTTIFYIAGSLLAIGAAILLITKRRMGADE